MVEEMNRQNWPMPPGPVPGTYDMKDQHGYSRGSVSDVHPYSAAPMPSYASTTSPPQPSNQFVPVSVGQDGSVVMGEVVYVPEVVP